MIKYTNTYSDSHLLAIGIDDYQSPKFSPLGNAESDAQSLAEILSGEFYNFSVQTLLGEQATKRAILQSLDQLEETQPNDRVIVYFSGHGYTLKNNSNHEVGYLACVDTLPEKHRTALKMEEITSLRDHAPAKHIAFIFDACFSGQALGLTKATTITTNVDEFLLRRSYQVISAGAADQTVSDYQSMTATMLDKLRNPSELLTLDSLGLYLKQTLPSISEGKQIPQFGQITGSQGGDFVLYLPPEAKPIDLLPERLRRSLLSDNADTRYYALGEVERLLADRTYARPLLEVLKNLALTDPDMEVKNRALDILMSSGKGNEERAEVAVPTPTPSREIPEIEVVPAVEKRPLPTSSMVSQAYWTTPIPDEFRKRSQPTGGLIRKGHDEEYGAKFESMAIMGLGRGTINDISLSADKKMLAIASSAGVYLHDASTFEMINQIEKTPTLCVGWSPNNRWLLVGQEEFYQIWDQESNDWLEIPFHVSMGEETLQRVAWSSDSEWFAGATKEGLVIIGKITEGEIDWGRELEGHTERIIGLAWYPDGTHLISSSLNDTTFLWDAENGEQLKSLDWHTNFITTISWSPDGTRVASAAIEESISVWEIDKFSEPLLSIGLEGFEVAYDLAWTPDNQSLAISTEKGFGTWDLVTNKYQFTDLNDGSDFSARTKWLKNGQKLMRVVDETVKVWDVKSKKQIAILEGHTSPVTCLVWSPDSKWLASGSSGSNNILIWDVEKQYPVGMLKAHTDTVNCLDWSPDGRTLISGSEDQSIILWDVVNMKQIAKLDDHDAAVTDVVWSPDNAQLGSASGSKITIWDAKEIGKINTVLETEERIYSLAWSSKGILAAEFELRKVKLWNSVKKEFLPNYLQEIFGDIKSIVWSPDGMSLAIEAEFERYLYHIESGEFLTVEFYRNEYQHTRCVRWSPDGTLLVSISEARVAIWDIEGNELYALRGSDGSELTSVAWSPDGNYLASSSENGRIQLYRVTVNSD